MQDAIMSNDLEVKYPIVNILEEPEYCKLKVHYEADPTVVIGKVDDAVASLRNLAIPGFRKGKAPDSAIKVKLRQQINKYVTHEMVSNALDDVIFELNIKPIGQPKFSDLKISNNRFSCDIEIFKKPSFELSQLKFDIPKPPQQTDEDSLAERSLYNMRLQLGEVQPYEDTDCVENGDQITFSFTATINNESFDGSVIEGELYTVGSNRWTNFDENLIGMKAGESKEFDFTFVDGLLAGNTANFNVTVFMGTKRKPHPLNDELYQMVGVQNVEELLNKLKTISKMSLDRNRLDAIREQVAIKLLEANKFEIPSVIIEDEAKYLASQQQVVFDKLPDSDKTKYRTQAEQNSRLSLILDSVRESEPDSVLNEIEAKNAVVGQLQARGANPEQVLNNPQVAAMLIHSVKDEFTLQWIAEQANIIE